MKAIETYILEKLHIGKETKVDIYNINDLNDMDDKTFNRFLRWYKFPSKAAESKAWKEMKYNIDNNASAKKLAKAWNPDTLFKRWWMSIIYGWDNGIIEFGNALTKFVPITDLHRYVVQSYFAVKNIDDINKHYRHYFDLYGINY